MVDTGVGISLNLTDCEATQMMIFLRYLTRPQMRKNVLGQDEVKHVEAGFDKLRLSLCQAGYGT